MSVGATEAVLKKKVKFISFSWSWFALPSLFLFWFVAVMFMDFNQTGSFFPTDIKYNRTIPQVTDVVEEAFVRLKWDKKEKRDAYNNITEEYHWYTLGALGPHILQSFKEVSAGFIVAVIVALLVGFGAGFYRGFREYITPINGVFMSIPAIAWAPMMLLFFKDPFVAIMVVVCIAAIPPMVIAIMEGVLTITGTEVRAARSLGANVPQLFIYIYLPASLPFITAGLRIGFAQAWRALVAAEMFAGLGIGLGHVVKMASQLGDDRTMMLAVVLIGLLSYLFERLIFRRIEKHYEVWRIN